MDRAIIDLVERVLRGKLVRAEDQREALLACLDLAEPDDEDAGCLRAILEDEGLPDPLAAFRDALAGTHVRR